MKKSFSKIINLTTRHAIFFSFLIAGAAAKAAPLSEAHVSQVIQDVHLLATNAPPRPAAINDKVEQGTAVRTGTQSRAELTFTDLTITRLGENTIFSLNAAAREIDVTRGSVLLQVPANSAPAKISTAAVTAAITGGTALFGTGPPVKFMVLEGVGTFYPAGHPELAVTIPAGEMVTLTADGHISVPKTFDVKTVVATSALIVGFPDLANLPLILQVMDQQQVDQSTASSSPPPSKDIVDTTSQNTSANPALSPPPSGGPPSEFGPPPTISPPDPYLITSGTTITTDPTITTNGTTDFGKLYRGTALDGSPTAFLFGEAPTVFDQLVFNGAQNNLPVAVFKFADLQLTGDPTITVPSGATTNLALVSVGNITSGSPGGTLTFAGITRLDFITQNGSINLGSDISFSGIDHLMFYARGSGSNLTLASPISGGSVVHLFSQGTVQVNGNITVTDDFQSISGGDFLAGTGVITATNIDIASVNGNLNIDGSQFPNPPDNTGSVVLSAGNTLNLVLDNRPAGFGWSSFDASATTINITGNNTFDFNSADVSIVAGSGGIQASTVNFVNGVSLLMQTINGGDINIHGLSTSQTVTDQTGGNVDLTSANDIVSSGSLIAARSNGGITDGLNITIAAGGAINVGGGLNLTTDASNLATGGNIVVTSGGNMTIGGAFTLFISAASGTTTGVGGDINVTSGGSLTAGSLNFDLFFDPSAQVTNGENLTLTVTNNLITTAGGVSLVLSTPVGPARPPLLNGGNVSMTIGGNLTLASGGGLDMEMINSGTTNVPIGGNISASIGGNLSADQITASLTNFDGGIIGTGGNLTFSVGGKMTASSVALDIDNSSNGAITTGGNLNFHVGGDANLGNVTLSIENNGGGVISSGGDLTASFGASLTASNVNLNIDNSAGGQIGGSGNISLTTVGDLTTSDGGVNLTLQNTGGTITTGGNITLAVGGNVSTQGLSLILENFDFSANPAGSIGTGGNILATVGGNLTADFVDMFIGNRAGGMIGSGGNMTLAVNGALTTTGDAGFIIDNRFDSSTNGSTVASTISSPVTLAVSAASVNIGGSLASATIIPGSPFSGIINRGSTINGDATYKWNVTGDMTVGGAAQFDLLNGEGNSGVPIGGTIHGNALLQVVAGSLTATGVVDPFVGGNVPAVLALLDNKNSGVIDGNATINFTITGDLTANNGPSSPGDAFFLLQNQQNRFGTTGGSIGGAAMLTINAADMSVAGDFDVEIDDQRGFNSPGPSGGSIGTNATLTITATSLSVGGELDALINNQNNGSGSGAGGSIGGSATINLNLSGDLITTGSDSNSAGIAGDANLLILNANLTSGTGGSIGSNATIGISAANISIAGSLDAEIQNNGGAIGSDAVISMSANNVSAGYLQASISNHGGNIAGNANVNFSATGNLTTTQTDAFFDITNRNGGTIGSNASINVTAASLSTGFLITAINNNANGLIRGNATEAVNVSGDINAANGILAEIADTGFQNTDNTFTGGTITGSATVTLQGQNIITPSTATGVPGTDTMALEASIYTNVNGSVGGDAIINVNASQQISAPGTVLFWVANGNYQNLGPGQIGGNAAVNVSAANISTGDFFFQILNYGGASIGQNATLTQNVSNSLNVNGSLDALIDNTGGTIGGNATINMNLTNNTNLAPTANVSGDANFQILGDDPAGSAAINFNGGSYNVTGNFLSTIDGNGTIKFNNASIQANTIRAGVFGPNGTLLIGSGPLSATTLMKLYATGTSGTIDFTKSVTLTLSSQTAAIILAANKITIDQNVVVTIVGSFPASVYANIANYVGGTCGNACGSFGSFAGAGATTSALSGAPAFGDPPSSSPSAGGSGSKTPSSSSTTVASATTSASTKTQSSSTTSTNVASSSRITGATRGTRQSPSQSGVSTLATRTLTSANTTTTTSNTIKIADSGQLLSMLDSATPNSNGKIMITSSKGDGVSNNPTRSNAGGSNAASGLSQRRATENQTSSKTSVALLDRTPPSVR